MARAGVRGFADGFARAAAVRLDELRTVARERYAAALLACGATDRAIAELTDLTTEHPLREGPHAELMRALHLAGRQPEALEVYRGMGKHRIGIVDMVLSFVVVYR